MTTYTSQPDETDGIDSYINLGSANTNYAAAAYMSIGYSSGSGIMRGLLKFDLSKGTNPPPASATVSSVTLTMNCSTYNVSRTVSVYRVLRNWVESEVTANIYSTGNNWTTAGCGSAGNDYDNTVLASASVASTGAKTFTLNADGIAVVQNWINSGYANYGLLLKDKSESGDYNRFDSSSATTSTNRPKLVIEYTTGSGGFLRKTAIFEGNMQLLSGGMRG